MGNISELYASNMLRAELAGHGLMLELLSLKADWSSEGLDFNLYVAPFPNICVSNFKLEGLWSEWSELVVRGWTE